MSHEEIDWPGLRAAAVAIGIRKAARQATRDLPPNEQERFIQRAMKRCSREKWLVKSEQDKADAILNSPSALSANVRNGADVLKDTLSELGQSTRIAAARVHHRALTYAEILSGEELIQPSTAHAVKAHVQSASIVHGWPEEQEKAPVTVNVLNYIDLQRGKPK